MKTSDRTHVADMKTRLKNVGYIIMTLTILTDGDRPMPPFRYLPAAFAVILGGLFMLSSPTLAADCQPMVDDFNRAIDAGDESAGQALIDKIATSAECGRYQVAAQRRLAALRLNAAQLQMARGRPVMDYERALVAADTPEVLWQAAATLGEVRFGERRFVDAARAYDRAIEIVKNETLTPTAPSKFEIQEMIDRAGQARLLAASGLAAGGGEKFIQTAKDQRDGTLGGFYSRSVRGIIPRALPIPITFDYRKTTLTDVGQAAARELLDALKEQRPGSVVLIGHTDVRGTAEFNVKLSRDRAQTVAAFLKENGVVIPVEVEGKGSSEPMRLSDTSGLTDEDIYALNRRVEWRRQ
jgi:outer membrane protein OmpA-like peptidoglycan-associated protein